MTTRRLLFGAFFLACCGASLAAGLENRHVLSPDLIATLHGSGFLKL